MLRLISTIFAALFSLTTALYAQSTPVVVELYTSQGCSSCPPADRYLSELARRDDVIALALHVDYWDYLGWADSFADPDYSKRQRAYAAAAKQRTVFTPQIIVQGKSIVVGNRVNEVEAEISKIRTGATLADLSVTRDGEDIKISIAALAEGLPRAVVQLVRFKPRSEVSIKRGENAGKSVVYTNIVTHWSKLSKWDGHKNLELTRSVVGSGPLAVIVQAEKHGPILAARILK